MKYSYKAIKNSKVVKGYVEAQTPEEASQSLRARNMTVIKIQEKDNLFLRSLKNLVFQPSFNDVVNLTRQLAIMLNAGLTLVNSLDILKKQINKTSLLKVVNDIDDDIRSGLSFSAALQRHRGLFGNLYIALVKAGEASGKLDEVLLRLADNLEKKRILIGKIKGALIYPIVLIIGMLVVMFIMISFVVPKLLTIYEDFGQGGNLPTITKVLIAISSVFEKFWPIIIIGVAAAVIAIRAYALTRQGKIAIDSFTVKIPVIGDVIKISSLVDVTRTFSILIGSGVSILETINIVKQTSSNYIFENAFGKIYARVEKGESLGRALEAEHIFPPILVQMATVGEESGHLDETLMRISRYFEIESEEAIKTMTTLIEPTILVILGVGVGFIVMAVISPIYNLTQSVQ